jgi:hypothetical protein
MCVKTKLFHAVAAVSVVAAGLISCGGKATQSQGYSGGYSGSSQSQSYSEAPRSRPASQTPIPPGGLKREKEECDQFADEPNSPYRSSGIGVSREESQAENMALGDARAKLAGVLAAHAVEALTKFNQEYQKEDQRSFDMKQQMSQKVYYEKFLTGTPRRCKNTYDQADGTVKVTVAVELDDGRMSQIHKQISKDAKMDIDFSEHIFMEEMKEMRQQFLEAQR